MQHSRRSAIERHANGPTHVPRHGGRGLVAVGFSGASGVDTVPMAVLEVLRQLPETHVRLLEERIEELVSGLTSGLCDIVVGPTGNIYRDPLIAAEVLYEEPIHLVCRVGHQILELARPTWADVLSYPWVLWARGTPVRNAFDQALIDAAQRPPVTYVESNAATLSTTLLIHSDMIGVASLRPALRYQRMNMLQIIPLELSATSSASMYWRTHALNRPAVAAAMAAVRETARAAG